MNLFAIGDLHLSTAQDIPMDIFGANWDNHWQQICSAWQNMVENDDIVLIPGDISWAMTLEQAEPDLQAIADLPGKKVILRGNHDYWWASLSKLQVYEQKGIYTLQNNAFRFGNAVICGTRGWTCPSDGHNLSAADDKIYQREAIRLKLSLDAGMRLKQETDQLVVMFHYPPLSDERSDSLFLQLLREYQVNTVLYGHLHGPSFPWVYEGSHQNMNFHLVSCDYLKFIPKHIAAL